MEIEALPTTAGILAVLGLGETELLKAALTGGSNRFTVPSGGGKTTAALALAVEHLLRCRDDAVVVTSDPTAFLRRCSIAIERFGSLKRVSLRDGDLATGTSDLAGRWSSGPLLAVVAADGYYRPRAAHAVGLIVRDVDVALSARLRRILDERTEDGTRVVTFRRSAERRAVCS